MPAVNPSDVTALLTSSTTAVEQAVSVATRMAKAYTRGRGFEADIPNDEIAAAITTAAARLATNGSGILYRKRVGDVEEEFRSSFQGWTLAEQAVLNRYRVRAQ